MRAREVVSGLIAAAWMLGWMPLGCGAAQEEYTVVTPSPSELSTTNEWTLPEFIVEQLRQCVKTHAAELSRHSHETKFDLQVTEQGDVWKVKLRHSTLHHGEMESCMTRALAAVSIPSAVLPLRSSEPYSGGESTREERGPVGVVQALGGAVVLGPIVLIAAGVTVGVYIVATVAAEEIEAAKRRTKREKWCYERLYECVGRHLECSACFIECKKDGVWDERKCPLRASN